MNIFGYNLSNNNKISFVRDNYLKVTDTGRSNLYFGYSSRSGSAWGNSVLIYTKGIGTTFQALPANDYLTGTPDTEDYYAAFFGQNSTSGNLFKIMKAGSFPGDTDYPSWNSPWLLIEKTSTASVNLVASISFETLLSEQNISSTSNVFKIYRDDAGTLTEITSSTTTFEIENIFNSDNAIYDAPMNCRLVGIGNTEASTIENIKFVRNITDGSFAKCFNVDQLMVNKIITETINLSETIFDLRNDADVTIISGLSYRSLLKITDVDYALIFEYATQNGSKNLVLTTENFDTYIVADSSEKLGIFMDANIAETNTNINRIPAIDSSLVNNSIFVGSLNFGYTTPPTVATDAMFFKYLLTDQFIEHNKIPLTKIYWITQTDMSNYPSAGWTDTREINGRIYYVKLTTDAASTPEYYNIENILIEIDLGTDFTFTDSNTYDLTKTSTGYQIRNGFGDGVALLNSADFSLREIMLYYKNDSSLFVPVYYARTNIVINNYGSYTFQIIL